LTTRSPNGKRRKLDTEELSGNGEKVDNEEPQRKPTSAENKWPQRKPKERQQRDATAYNGRMEELWQRGASIENTRRPTQRRPSEKQEKLDNDEPQRKKDEG
jgi:hypothetical protein